MNARALRALVVACVCAPAWTTASAEAQHAERIRTSALLSASIDVAWATRASGQADIRVDGLLEEPVWRLATPLGDLRQQEPRKP